MPRIHGDVRLKRLEKENIVKLKTTSHIALGLAGIACLTMPSSATVIFDQIASADEMVENPNSFTIYFSQINAKDSGSGVGGANIVAVDDFEVKEGQNILTQIDALMSSSAVLSFMDVAALVTGWSVQIYSSKDAAIQSAGNGFAGDVASLAISSDLVSIDIENEWNQLYFSDPVGLVSLDLGELVLSAGQYWISVVVEKETPEFGVGVFGSPIHDGPGESHSAFSVRDTGEVTEWNNNLAYRIHAIPAPGAMALLGLAGVISRRRRRG